MKFKILYADSASRSIGVEYYTDTLEQIYIQTIYPAKLAMVKQSNPNDTDEWCDAYTRQQYPMGIRLNIQYVDAIPSGQALLDDIADRCPADHLTTKEKILTTPPPDMTEAVNLVGQVFPIATVAAPVAVAEVTSGAQVIGPVTTL